MAYKLDKDDIAEIVRLWDVPQIMEALANGIPAQDLVNGRKTDVLLSSILKRSEPLFLQIMSKPFDLKKNKFSYFTGALSIASSYKDYIYIKTLLSKMDDIDLQMRSSLNHNNHLHCACLEGLQNVALILSQRGLSWESINKEKQTPLHILLRKVPFLEKGIIEDIKNVNINKKDIVGISCKDIIKSFSYDEEWASREENQLLMKTFNI